MNSVEVLGHRGNRLPGPENTVAAVRRALEAGAAGVEIDVRRTADGRLVCVHDPVAGRRPVVEATAADLAGRGIPSIAEVLDAAAGGRVVVEVKNQRRQPDYDGRRGTSARLLVELLNERRAAGQQDEVVVSSFDGTAVIVARAAGFATGLLTLPRVPVFAGLRAVLRAGHLELHAHTSALPTRAPRRAAAAVARVHEENVRLVVWTVTSVDDALRLRDAGVDSVICDDPAGVVAALADGTRRREEPDDALRTTRVRRGNVRRRRVKPPARRAR
jgi:glycerophosphoryl diester phosphodiesterase